MRSSGAVDYAEFQALFHHITALMVATAPEGDDGGGGPAAPLAQLTPGTVMHRDLY